MGVRVCVSLQFIQSKMVRQLTCIACTVIVNDAFTYILHIYSGLFNLLSSWVCREYGVSYGYHTKFTSIRNGSMNILMGIIRQALIQMLCVKQNFSNTLLLLYFWCTESVNEVESRSLSSNQI